MSGNRKRILCIEDDRETAALVAEELTDRGYAVQVAHDGREGLQAIRDTPPDLVLADISMPVMSGFEVLERLTTSGPQFGHIPFVFLTALADRENKLRGWQLGADDYVTKPVDFDVLAALIAARMAGVARTELTADREATLQRASLHEREIETLTWAARGKTSAEIGQILGIAKRTVDFHIENARAKLGVATRMQAVVKATATKLIEP